MAIKQKNYNEKSTPSRRSYRKIVKQEEKSVPPSKHMRSQRRQKEYAERRKNKIPKRRILPIWLRVLLVAISCMIVLACGLMFGFGIIGDGDPLDALKVETWQQIIDIVKKDY